MTSNRFFIKKSDIHSSTLLLYGDEHHHLSRVARIKPEEKVWLFDEQGANYLAKVEEIRKDMTRLSILQTLDKNKPKVKITLAQAILKSKKMDLIIQKSTELAVTNIIPVLTARTIVKVEEKIQKKIERWKKIALEAVKQSQRSFLPSISSPTPVKKLIEERREEKKLLLSENRGKYLRDILIEYSGSELNMPKPPSSVLILVGPEGGWTEEEEEFILSNGYEAVSLGVQTLRAETAALCGLVLISHFWNL
ncbi:MAG: 16S rRNA (uracil(1498)-N(3))-methyltransferase [Candidatus Aminicenantes bacterium]|nr:16S rRNA (uracil(1498)-N(3))-methyltransferase [Candidatus Aminicenantes bacterium]